MGRIGPSGKKGERNAIYGRQQGFECLCLFHELYSFTKKWAESFDTSLSGTICVRLKNGGASYVSRRYVPAIKQILGI